MSVPASLVWFRRDLRLADNPALSAARARGGPLIPVYIHAPGEESPWEPGAASQWWLHQSLARLDESLRAVGSRLIVRRGPTLETLRTLIAETGARAVFWNRLYEPNIIARDTVVKTALREEGHDARSFNAALLFEPWQIERAAGGPFKVFTPFWRACRSHVEPSLPDPAPKQLPAPDRWPTGESIESLNLLPRINWVGGIKKAWVPGEAGARQQLEKFTHSALARYEIARDLPAEAGTSRLSPHLHFGEIGPRDVWHAVRRVQPTGKDTDRYLTEIGWREFAHHLLFHFPHTTHEPLRPEFRRFPWRDDSEQLRAWQRGQTGYPLVDAGMRELWNTGWMHNRVRMVVASFLVKHLRLSWQAGAAWFWDTLVDADLANNTFGWQWAAGCGADAAPYFRIFNPILQGEKFDATGAYVRRWVPEIAHLPNKVLFQPWKATRAQLSDAGVVFGRDYPAPIVDHAQARENALAAFATLKVK